MFHFRAAALATRESDWRPLIRRGDGKSYVTDQEWAEVVYLPNWAGHSRQRPQLVQGLAEGAPFTPAARRHRSPPPA